MDTAEWEAELNLLLNEMQNQPEDRYEFLLQLREKLDEIRAVGMPVPDDLAKTKKARRGRRAFPSSVVAADQLIWS